MLSETCALSLKDWQPIRRKDSKSNLAIENSKGDKKPAETPPLDDLGLPTVETQETNTDQGEMRVVSATTVLGFEDSILAKPVEAGVDSQMDSPASSFQRELEAAFNGDVVHGEAMAVSLPNRAVSTQEGWAKLFCIELFHFICFLKKKIIYIYTSIDSLKNSWTQDLGVWEVSSDEENVTISSKTSSANQDVIQALMTMQAILGSFWPFVWFISACMCVNVLYLYIWICCMCECIYSSWGTCAHVYMCI